jgi:hypothetical protein
MKRFTQYTQLKVTEFSQSVYEYRNDSYNKTVEFLKEKILTDGSLTPFEDPDKPFKEDGVEAWYFRKGNNGEAVKRINKARAIGICESWFNHKLPSWDVSVFGDGAVYLRSREVPLIEFHFAYDFTEDASMWNTVLCIIMRKLLSEELEP